MGKGDRTNQLTVSTSLDLMAPDEDALDPVALAKALNELPKDLQLHEIANLRAHDSTLAAEILGILEDLPRPEIQTIAVGAYYDPGSEAMVFPTVTIIEGEATEVSQTRLEDCTARLTSPTSEGRK